jgi:hypothetical protein
MAQVAVAENEYARKFWQPRDGRRMAEIAIAALTPRLLLSGLEISLLPTFH